MPIITEANARDYMNKEELLTMRKYGKSIYLPQGKSIYLPEGSGYVYKDLPGVAAYYEALKKESEEPAKKQGSGIERQTEESLYPKYSVNNLSNKTMENPEIVDKIVKGEGKGFQIIGFDDEST